MTKLGICFVPTLPPARLRSLATAAEIAGRIRRLAGFGVTSVTIQPTEDEPDLEGFIGFLGRDVRPLVR